MALMSPLLRKSTEHNTSLLRSIASYVRFLPTVLRKTAVMHRHSLFLDEASPEQLNTCLRAWRVCKREYGYLGSLIARQCLDRDAEPIPWYTYPAIEQLAKWDFSDCDVLEYGCGNSTLWWAKRARSVTSVESSPEWFETISSRVPENCKLILRPVANPERPRPEELERYVQTADSLGMFDVIVVDGVNTPGLREQCAERGLRHFRTGGLLVLDNSDWLPLTCRKMRERGFLEFDYSGLGPLNDFAETTSLFVRGDFRIKPNSSIHPGYALGGRLLNRDAIA